MIRYLLNKLFMRVTKTEPHSAVTFYAMLAVKPGLLSHLLLISRSEEEREKKREILIVLGVTKRLKGRRRGIG